jgi:hypothetical protein
MVTVGRLSISLDRAGTLLGGTRGKSCRAAASAKATADTVVIPALSALSAERTVLFRIFLHMRSQKRAGGMKDLRSEKNRLDAIRIERKYVLEQIHQSERTIERSRELIKQLDELLAKDGMKP